MPIDTAEKRRNISALITGLFGVGVTPNSAKDLEWRQQVGWSYSGVTVGPAVPPSVETIWIPGEGVFEVYPGTLSGKTRFGI